MKQLAGKSVTQGILLNIQRVTIIGGNLIRDWNDGLIRIAYYPYCSVFACSFRTYLTGSLLNIANKADEAVNWNYFDKIPGGQNAVEP